MKFLRIFAIVAILLVASGCVLLYIAWENLNQPLAVDQARLVQIPRGASADETIAVLSRQA